MHVKKVIHHEKRKLKLENLLSFRVKSISFPQRFRLFVITSSLGSKQLFFVCKSSIMLRGYKHHKSERKVLSQSWLRISSAFHSSLLTLVRFIRESFLTCHTFPYGLELYCSSELYRNLISIVIVSSL